MKKYFLITAVFVLASAAAFGQARTKPKPKAKPVAAKKVPVVFEREPFDPKRSPKLDLEKAIAVASKNGKRIVLDVGGEWCSWCVYMDKFFGKNPKLALLRDDNFVWIKVNWSEENENADFLSAYPAIVGYPHLFVLDESGKLLHSQDTALLEDGKGYDLAKFTEFLMTWSPKKIPSAVRSLD